MVPAIPVNQLGDDHITIEKIAFDEPPELENENNPNGMTAIFFLLGKVSRAMEVNF
ncbi:MAG: hypothetical protein ABIN91_22300 [Mucilaginibacter sp.]|uniref:hypothetical protein n=1 Tax=Mucilaginibacter sp. TaxID=1882438 RepID=UPI003265ED71